MIESLAFLTGFAALYLVGVGFWYLVGWISGIRKEK